MMAEAVSRYIEAQLGHVRRWSFKDDTPDELVVTFDETTPVADYSSTLALDWFGVQVIVRALDYDDARARALDIHRLLLAFSGELAAGFPYVIDLQLITAPASMGRDNKNRAEFTAHYALLVSSEGDAQRT